MDTTGMDEPILPIELKPSVLRPFAYRVLTKKYGLNVQSTALEKLASYVGRRFGVKWKKDPKTSAFLDAVAKLWKEQGRGIFVDGTGISEVIKEITANEQRRKKRISEALKEKEVRENNAEHDDEEGDVDETSFFDTTTFDTSFISSSQAVEQTQPQPDINQSEVLEWKEFFKIPDINHYTRFSYDRRRKQFDYSYEKNSAKLIRLPQVEDTLGFYMLRLDVLRDRIYRNNIFSKMKYDNSTKSKETNQTHQPKYISYVKNLLGRNEQRFVLFGLVTLNSYGVWQLQDDSDKIELVLKQCIFPEDTYFVSGNFLIVDGFYSSAGKFHVLSMAHPPAEDRATTIDAFGNIDFNWDFSKNGKIDLTMQSLTQKEIKHHPDHKIIVLGGDLYLDDLKTVTKLKKVLQEIELELGNNIQSQDGGDTLQNLYDRTISIVFNGPFVSKPLTVTEGTSVNQVTSSGLYKASFDNLATLLESFKLICEHCKLVFVPGDEDPWMSMVTKNSNAVWPKMKIPQLFGSRLERVAKDFVWASNPCRMNYLSHDIAIVKDEIGESLRRNDFSYMCELNKQEIEIATGNSNEQVDQFQGELSLMNGKDLAIDKLLSKENPDLLKFKKISKTICDQGILSPFSSNVRRILPNYWPLLTLLPLPHCLVMCDSTSPNLSTMYKGCLVCNVGKFLDNNGRAHILEYYPSAQTSKNITIY